MKKIYLDNGATTKVADEVAEAMSKYFKEDYGNPSSLHEFGRKAKDALDKSREAIAKKINAFPEEIIFTSGGSESDNLALRGIAYQYKDKGNHIITSIIEHPAILGTCAQLEKEGFKITYLKVDKQGFISLDDLKKAITKDTILVSIMHANNEIGTIQDIQAIGKICKENNVFFHTDAVQSFTKIPIDVKSQNIDLASFASHKIHGPKGVGALYLKKGIKIKKLIHGGHQESDKRAGTENIPGIVGFAKAVELMTHEKIQKVIGLRDKLIDTMLKEIPHTQLNGPKEKRLCNNVNIAFNFVEGESILLHLDMKGIAVSTGSACSSHSLNPSHVLLAIGLPHEVAHGCIRMTLSYYNTEQDIDTTVKEMKEIIAKLRELSPLYNG